MKKAAESVDEHVSPADMTTGDVKNASYVLPPSDSLSTTSSLSPLTFFLPLTSGSPQLFLSYFSLNKKMNK